MRDSYWNRFSALDENMNSLHREPPHETVKAALMRGDLHGALRVLIKLNRRELLETVLRCGFTVSESGSTKAIFAHLQPQIVRAARLKVDGFGLHAPQQSNSESHAPQTRPQPASEDDIKPFMAAARYLRDVAYNAHHLVGGNPTGMLFLATRLRPEFQAELLKDRFKLDTDTAKTLVRYAASLPPRHLNEDQTLRVLTYFPAMLEMVNQAKQRISERKGNTVSAPVAHLLV